MLLQVPDWLAATRTQPPTYVVPFVGYTLHSLGFDRTCAPAGVWQRPMFLRLFSWG